MALFNTGSQMCTRMMYRSLRCCATDFTHLQQVAASVPLVSTQLQSSSQALCRIEGSHTQLRSFWGSSSSTDKTQTDEEARKNAEAMLNLMANSPRMQQMMMRMLPANARDPEMVKQLLADPGMKEKLVDTLAKQKVRIPSHILANMSSGHLDSTFDRAAKMGLNPDELFSKLVSKPELLAKLQQPKIMSAFMDMTTNPQNAAKYKDDQETLEVIREVKAVLAAAAQPGGTAATAASTIPSSSSSPDTQPGAPAIALGPSPDAPTSSPSSSSTPSAPDASTSPTSVPPPPGSPPTSGAAAGAAAGNPLAGMAGAELMSMMMTDPELMRRMENPKVQKALQEISKSPWKTVKYVLDREVMEVFSALNNMMRGKDPWTGKPRAAPPAK